jgi:PAS domain S-box-containing protein
VVDAEYRIISANRAYCDSVRKSVEEVMGRHCYEVSHKTDKPCYEAGEECPVRHTFETGNPYAVSHTHRDKAGNPVYIESKSYALKDASGKTTAVIETIADITEKRQLEGQLFQAQKMEAIGQLAGGVAHDFNNILSAIMGYGSLLMLKMKDNDPLRSYVEPIMASAKGAANLTQSLLAFSRKQIINPRPVDLNEIAKKMEKLLLRVIGEDIELKTRLIDRDLIVMADSGQMEQVLMNLCTNARDAMPKGGPLCIDTNIAELDGEFRKTHGYGEPGLYAVLSVTDKGTGMNELTRSKIFEPFFTTKEIGKGTGLGLSIVYGIIKQHNGYINCCSAPESETIFRIYLPLTQIKNVEKDYPAALSAEGGTETILLAEDEPIVRKITKAMLEESGYKVIEAADGEDAVRTFADNKDAVRLLLFDLVMPRKNGKEAYEEIKKTSPGIRALFISGYTADVIYGNSLFDQGLVLVPKPVSSTDLLTKVREVLDSRQGPP